MLASYAGSVQSLEERRAAGTQYWEVNMDLLIYGNVAYFVILLLLRWWMKDRDAYNPRLFMQMYNLSCVVLAGISGVCIGLYKLNHIGGKFVCNERGTQLNDTADGLLQWGFWFFYHQKFWEFLDTFIFMLRKSYRQVSFLHVFHHSSITFITALGVQYDASGDTYLASLLNSWVHGADVWSLLPDKHRLHALCTLEALPHQYAADTVSDHPRAALLRLRDGRRLWFRQLVSETCQPTDQPARRWG